jgi:SAM-dependent methyltransferase
VSVTGSQFADASFWDEYGLTPDYMQRIGVIRSLLPGGVKTLLDLGCGKGDVINALKPDTRALLVGTDPFLEALYFVNAPSVQASLPHLPFRDSSFDLVLCLQVLEHLSPENFYSSLYEIARLAKRYIILGVPYEENLEDMQVICANCHTPSHAFGHRRSFSNQDVDGLLPGYALRRSIFTGVFRRRKSGFGVWLEHRLGHIYHSPKDFVCPYCGSSNVSLSSRPMFVRRLLKKASNLFTLAMPSLPYWTILFYEKSPVEFR